ncbi:hypothetical protein A2U01_0027787, partial [Trifolium medium]|nr:hypothetical protein [Trifolium medium]
PRVPWGSVRMVMGTNIPRGNGNGGKNSPAGTSGRGTRKLPPHIPRPVDIPRLDIHPFRY